VLLVAALTSAVETRASAGGRTGFSGNPSTNAGATCNVCHAPDGATAPGVTIIGPPAIDAGTTHNYVVTVLGGPAQTAGVGISSQDGIGALLPAGGDLTQMDGELTHTGPKGFSGGAVTFEFQYTAPNYDTVVTLHAAANSTNGGLDLLGDGIAATSLAVTIENGFEPPPNPPAPATGDLEATLFASGLDRPVAIEHAGDDRLFVVERPGLIRVLEGDGTLLAQPFLDIQSQVKASASEQGLLGLAFHPDYANNGYFYVYYTRDPGPGLDRTRVSRFRVSGNPDIADAGSELVLLEYEQPYANHNGGDIHFGPDGYLYIASGDGGSGGDPQDNGQTTTTLLGKLLRIDVDTAPSPGYAPDCDITGNGNYRIPAGNAFNDGAGGAGCDEVYILGLRNPWRFTFDALTGAMWIADVGQNAHEEVNYLPPGGNGGLNLGWRCYEGTAPYNTTDCNLVYLPPVHTYSHATSGCSITGGRVYRSQSRPKFQGQYFFTDFCQGSIRALSGSPGDLAYRIALPAGELSAISTFGEDVNGDLYVAELNTGRIYRLDPLRPNGCQ